MAATLGIESIQALIKFIDTDPGSGLDLKRAELGRLPRDFVATLEAGLELLPALPETPGPAADISPRHVLERQAVEAAVVAFYGAEMAGRLRRVHDDLFDDGIDMLIYNWRRAGKGGPASA